jgi:hypothetical protein
MQTVTFNHPFREAAGLADTAEVGALYQIGLAGRGYFLDLESGRMQVQSLPVLREQTDTNDEAGPGSLASQDLWRRQSRSWHEGAGQKNGDEGDSSAFRFLESKGVDVWGKWELSLLPDTNRVVPDTAPIQSLCVAAGQIFHQAGDEIRVSSDGVSWSSLLTTSAPPTAQMVTDGVDLYVATAVDVLKITATGVETSAFALAGANILAFSKGRMWGGVGDELYWMTPDSPTPTLAATAPWGSTSWEWTAITDGRRATYASGFAGDRSHVYRIPINDDGTGISAAVEAWTAPDGELVYSMAFYLGFAVLGTSLGVRFSVVDDVGDLTPGSYIPTAGPVRCFEPQGQYVWFGWSDYDSTSTGLGRMDLSVFPSPLTPAYASDLMFDGAGDVSSVVTFGEQRLFTVDGIGAIGESTSPVATGYLTGSEWTFGLDDNKLASYLDVTHNPLDGSVELLLSINGFTSGVLAESNRQGSNGPDRPFAINPITAHTFAMKIVLNAGVGAGPTVTGWKLLARPLPPQALRIVLPLLLTEQHDAAGVYIHGDPFEEFLFLRGLWRAGAPVTLQIGAESLTVFPANFEWLPYRRTTDKSGWTGTCVMELREVAQ